MDQTNIPGARNSDLPPCCRPVAKPENRKGFLWGIVYGILPHTFCILFLVLSVIGATTDAAFFGKFLAVSWFFPTLIALSFAFATISALFYLGKNNRLSVKGIKGSWKYLSVLYGTTLAVSLLFIYVIFPIAVQNMYNRPVPPNTSGNALLDKNRKAQNQEQEQSAPNNPPSLRENEPQADYTGAGAETGATANKTSPLTITVDIPCPGHAPLIIEEVKKIDGITNVTYASPNVFTVEFDSNKTSAENILSLEIFKTYKATVK